VAHITAAMRIGPASAVPLFAVVAAALGVVLSACGGQNASLSHRVDSWASTSSFSAQVSTIQTDEARIDTVQATNVPGAVRADCLTLEDDTRLGNQNLPTPDGRLTTLLRDAYNDADAAARDCYSGAAGDAPLLARSTTERAAANAEFHAAVVQFDLLTGRPAPR
jgi:hypothetical protein